MQIGYLEIPPKSDSSAPPSLGKKLFLSTTLFNWHAFTHVLGYPRPQVQVPVTVTVSPCMFSYRQQLIKPIS